MTTKTVYVCDHCWENFDSPCEEHEVECLAEKRRAEQRAKAAARFEPMCNMLLGIEFDDPIGAEMDGRTFLVSDTLNKRTIKVISRATMLVSTVPTPSKSDAALIKKVNVLLSA